MITCAETRDYGHAGDCRECARLGECLLWPDPLRPFVPIGTGDDGESIFSRPRLAAVGRDTTPGPMSAARFYHLASVLLDQPDPVVRVANRVLAIAGLVGVSFVLGAVWWSYHVSMLVRCGL
jgi:hypothetical protein